MGIDQMPNFKTRQLPEHFTFLIQIILRMILIYAKKKRFARPKMQNFFINTGHVSPPAQFWTGLKSSETINPYLILAIALGLVGIILTMGPYIYGKYYLNKYHAIRNL